MKLRCHSHSDLYKKMCIITIELVIEVMKDLGVRIDLVTPAWLSYSPFICFRTKSESTNKPICDCALSKS